MSTVDTGERPLRQVRGNTLVTDIRAVFTREMSLVLRDPFSVIFSLVQPLVFLALFGPLLAGSVDPAALNGQSPLQWFLPGVIVMICLFGTGTVGSNLLYEISLGSYERVLASPLRRSAILIGRSLKELAPLVVQAALITAVAIPFGFVLYPLHVIAGLLLLGVFGVGDRGVLQRAGDRLAQAGVDVLGGAAVAAVPVADLVRDDAAAGGRPALDPGGRRLQSAHLHRQRRAGAVRRLVHRPGHPARRPGRRAHLRRRPLGRHPPGPPRARADRELVGLSGGSPC